MESEEWKDIQDFSGYKCSNLGNIMSYKNDINGKLLKQKTDAYGYLSVTLIKDNHKHRRIHTHRIIAKLFIENTHNYEIVNHKDGNRTNNVATNLEWCTTTMNTQHYFRDIYRGVQTNKKYECDINQIYDYNIKSEEWCKIDDFPNYQCSSLGRIKSFRVYPTGMIITPYINIAGYLRIMLVDSNKKKHTCLVHRIIATAFISNPLSRPVVNHKNGIKTDNKIENLEWCTYAENIKHGFDVLGRTSVFGEDHSNAKITDAQVKEVILLMEENKMTQTEISDKTGVSIPTIKQIKAGNNWKHIENNISEKRYSKLSHAQILEIHKLSNSSEFTLQEIANKYDICADTVHNIKCGIEWSEITGQKYEKNEHTNSKLTEDVVMNIYKDSWNGELTEREICTKYNVSDATVNRIKNGRVWNSVTGHEKSTDKLPTYICTALSKEEVLDIYDLSWNSNLKQREIGKKYNIKQSTVNDIKTGRTWGKVTGHKK